MKKLIQQYNQKINILRNIKILGISLFVFLFLLMIVGYCYLMYKYTLPTFICTTLFIIYVFIEDKFILKNDQRF